MQFQNNHSLLEGNFITFAKNLSFPNFLASLHGHVGTCCCMALGIVQNSVRWELDESIVPHMLFLMCVSFCHEAFFEGPIHMGVLMLTTSDMEAKPQLLNFNKSLRYDLYLLVFISRLIYVRKSSRLMWKIGSNFFSTRVSSVTSKKWCHVGITGRSLQKYDNYER